MNNLLYTVMFSTFRIWARVLSMSGEREGFLPLIIIRQKYIIKINSAVIIIYSQKFIFHRARATVSANKHTNNSFVSTNWSQLDIYISNEAGRTTATFFLSSLRLTCIV